MFGLLVISIVPMLIMVIVLSWFVKPKDKKDNTPQSQDGLRTLMETGQISPMEYNELKLKALPFKR